MKATIFIILLHFSSSKCNVTNRAKDVETTTGLSTNENSAPREIKEVTERTHKVIKESKEYVYLENVLFALKNQNWTTEEQPCLDQTLRLIHGLQNFTLWAVWDWDSIASEPLGLLYGNRYQLGNFDECLYPPWAETHKELKTQYCLSEIVLERTDHPVKKRYKGYEKKYEPYGSAVDHLMVTHSRPMNELTWGVCVPAACAPRSVERLLATMLARSHLGAAGMKPHISLNEKCQTAEPLKFDGLYYAFIGCTAILTIVCLVCTYINVKNQESDGNSNAIIEAFCLKKNSRSLLAMKKEGAEVMYGIRFLTICLIVLDHQVGIHNAGPISNGLYLDDEVNSSFKTLLILHDDLFVDTFFFLSGFLLATTLTRLKRLPSPVIFILKRYLRLMVGFAVVIFYICAVFPYTGSGPLWNRAIEGDTEKCKKTWWISMLMLNNYVDTENICLIVSWYIPCDFHFFIITSLLYWIYKQSPRLGITLGTTVFVASIVATSVINYANELTPVQLFTYQFLTDIRGNKQFHLTYIKSHTRYPPYFIGFLSGFAFVYYKQTGNIKKISQKWSILGFLCGMLVMLAVMVDGVTFLWREYHPAEGALYAAFNRPVWTCGLAAVFFCLAFGRVPLVEGFLTWYPWVPLSRLAYGLFLTHTLFIARNVFSNRNSFYFDDQNVLTSGMGIIFWGSVSSLLIWLLAEAPLNNLLLVLISNKVNKTPADAENGISNPRVATVKSVSGNLQENLPSVVCFSKM